MRRIDLTNLATLRDWPVSITVIDLAWGPLSTSATSVLTTWIGEEALSIMTETITSDLLYKAILFRADAPGPSGEDLNRINVFPVIDNDTGTNLAHTMHSILAHARPHENVRDTLQDIARSALMGARGNSGAIFSQYFSGLYQHSAELQGVSLQEMAAYLQEAYHKAYRAIEQPVEARLSTLMRAWAVSFRESSRTA